MTRRTYTQSEKVEIARLFWGGTSPKEISQEFNMPESSVYGILHQNGVNFDTAPDLVPLETTVTVDENDTVQKVVRKPTPGPKEMWKVEFIGVMTVQAGSIFEALNEVKKLVAVQKITSASIQTP
jgi:hypothetical protein